MLNKTGKILKQLFQKQQNKLYRCNHVQPTKNGGMRNTGRQQKERTQRERNVYKEELELPKKNMKKRRVATKICRNKKKHWLNDRIRRIEEALTRNETSQFYKDIKTFRQAEQAGMSLLVCRDGKGNILAEKQQVLERWKHYLSEALDRELAPDMNSEREMENLNEKVDTSTRI